MNMNMIIHIADSFDINVCSFKRMKCTSPQMIKVISSILLAKNENFHISGSISYQILPIKTTQTLPQKKGHHNNNYCHFKQLQNKKYVCLINFTIQQVLKAPTLYTFYFIFFTFYYQI